MKPGRFFTSRNAYKYKCIRGILFHVTDLLTESECNSDRRILGWSDDNGFGQGFGDLIGFATDLQNLLDFFPKQHLGLKDHFVDDWFDNPQSLIGHIKELMDKIKAPLLKKGHPF